MDSYAVGEVEEALEVAVNVAPDSSVLIDMMFLPLILYFNDSVFPLEAVA